MNKQSWSVVIPCYNEKGTLEEVVQRVKTVLQQIASEFEIIVINDGSNDGSKELIDTLVKGDAHLRCIHHRENQGLGTVLRKGYFTARFENLISVPGDGQFDVQEIIPYAIVPQKTFISFYRQENLTYSFFRNKLSYFNKFLNKKLIGLDLKDVNWALIIKRNELENLNLEMKSTLIKSEICAKMQLLGYKPIEVQSYYHPRTYGVSKGSSLKMIAQAIADLWQLSGSVRRFRKKVSNP
ncbi:MAG: glycosyltransferase family 2 protein [Chitinophagales bacterium]|nr:glycosyltransferase family 2 protein [Chitinophagales bacterium]